MQHRIFSALALSTLVLPTAMAFAQDATPPPPPNVLVIQREYLRPGKAGNVHAQSEAAFVKASNDAKWPTHYMALDSMTGPTRALYVFAYDSFSAWGKDQEAQNANADFAKAIDTAQEADGDLLNRFDTGVMLYHPEMSLHDHIDVPHARYWEFTVFRIKPGHEKEWNDLAKMYTDGFAKAPDAHWATFESTYGEDNGGTWITINPMRSLDEIDKGMANGKSFATALGETGMQRAAQLSDASILSVQTNLFVVNPKESYPDPQWATAAPEVWGQH